MMRCEGVRAHERLYLYVHVSVSVAVELAKVKHEFSATVVGSKSAGFMKLCGKTARREQNSGIHVTIVFAQMMHWRRHSRFFRVWCGNPDRENNACAVEVRVTLAMIFTLQGKKGRVDKTRKRYGKGWDNRKRLVGKGADKENRNATVTCSQRGKRGHDPSRCGTILPAFLQKGVHNV